MGHDDGYQALAENATKVHPVGVVRRVSVVVAAILACLLNAGLVFGYSAIFPVLIDHGAFHDRCKPDAPLDEPCRAQLLALAGMFTLSTSALNIAGLPMGALLDRLGPRMNTPLMATTVACGVALFSVGGYGVWQWAYIVGFVLMAIAGPPIFVSTLSFPNLFPSYKGFITAALVGCFDASAAVFIGIAAAIEEGVSFGSAFLGYALVPLTIAIAAASLWPAKPFDEPPSSALGDGGPSLVVIKSSLADEPLKRQVASLEFWLLTKTLCVNMLCINFFISTVNLQMLSVDEDRAPLLSSAFAALLPAGGIVWIPVVGFVADRLGSNTGWVVLWVGLLSFAVLNRVYAATGLQAVAYVAFAVFSFCRPLLYTVVAAFTGEIFGFANFGTLYGLLFTIAGVTNLGIQPLSALAASSGFAVSNGILLVLQLTTIVLPIVIRRRHVPTVNLSESPTTFARMRIGSF